MSNLLISVGAIALAVLVAWLIVRGGVMLTISHLVSQDEDGAAEWKATFDAITINEAIVLAEYVLKKEDVVVQLATQSTTPAVMASLPLNAQTVLRKYARIQFGCGGAGIGLEWVRQCDANKMVVGYTEDGDGFVIGMWDETVFTSGLNGIIEPYANSIYHLILMLDATYSELPIVSVGNNTDPGREIK
jgi:hypothetical protein